jgi:hypothetical protein
MAKNLLDLANSLEKKAKAINESASQLAVKTTLTILGDLVYHTPVDSSKALSNWIVTLDSPSTDKIAPYYKGFQGSTQQQSAAEALAQAKRILESKKPGQYIYITNNQPYIRRLNDGYSDQQPAGAFVQRAVLIGRKYLSKLKMKV